LNHKAENVAGKYSPDNRPVKKEPQEVGERILKDRKLSLKKHPIEGCG